MTSITLREVRRLDEGAQLPQIECRESGRKKLKRQTISIGQHTPRKASGLIRNQNDPRVTEAIGTGLPQVTAAPKAEKLRPAFPVLKVTPMLSLEADEVGRYGLVYLGKEPPGLDGMVRFLPYDTMELQRTDAGIALSVLSKKEMQFQESQAMIGFARTLSQVGAVSSRF